MSIPDFFAGEELVTFGMPWHGLYVTPVSGARYIELASGRKIYSSMFAGPTPSNTYLVDLGLPEPALQPDDPEARLWNKYIASGNGNASIFNAWGLNLLNRRVRVGNELASISMSAVNLGPVLGAEVRAVISLKAGPRFLDVRAPVAPLQQLPSQYGEAFLLDTTPDGRRWMFGLRFTRSYTAYPYQIRVDQDADEGIGAIIEAVFSADFTSMTVNVLAGYTACMTGTNISAQDGGPLTQATLWLVGSAGSWAKYSGEGEPPNPPYQPLLTGTGDGPFKYAIGYGHGTSTATATKDRVIGGWYGPDGTPQLVTIRISTSLTLTAQEPVSRADMEQWWSPYVRDYQYAALVKIGNGSFQPWFTAGYTEDQNPNVTTYSLRFSSTNYSSVETNAPVIRVPSIHGEIITGAVGPRHDGAPRLAMASSYGNANYDLTWYAGLQSSNKVISAMARCMGNNQFEYVAGPAITPSGVDVGDTATGNLIPGHNRFASNFSQALWDYHTGFSVGAYNPVTGQIKRARLGGGYFTWV